MMAGPKAEAHGIDHIQELVDMATANTRKHHAALLDNGRVRFHAGDGRRGLPEYAPYDVIHVGASCSNADAAHLRQLLKVYFVSTLTHTHNSQRAHTHTHTHVHTHICIERAREQERRR